MSLAALSQCRGKINVLGLRVRARARKNEPCTPILRSLCHVQKRQGLDHCYIESFKAGTPYSIYYCIDNPRSSTAIPLVDF